MNRSDNNESTLYVISVILAANDTKKSAHLLSKQTFFYINRQKCS